MAGGRLAGFGTAVADAIIKAEMISSGAVRERMAGHILAGSGQRPQSIPPGPHPILRLAYIGVSCGRAAPAGLSEL